MISILQKDTEYELMEIIAVYDMLPLKDENWSERRCMLHTKFEESFKKIWNFELRTDDVFLVGFMKTGTTWMQEILWLLKNQLNFDFAMREDLMRRTAVLDFSGFSKENLEKCNKQKSPRVIKTHFPVNLLPKQLWEKQPKTIYLARNAKDVVVSSYHFLVGLGVWTSSLDEYVDDFICDKVMYAPFWQHIIDFWKLRHEPHIFFVTYEELKRDLKGVLQRLCVFLERPQLSEFEMKAMLEHLSFKNMKENKRTNCSDLYKSIMPSKIDKNFQFVRRGIIGSYKEDLTAEKQRAINEWTFEILTRHGIKEEDIFGKIE